MSETTLLVGCDPEFLLVNPKNGQLKSAIGVVKGTKENKFDLGNGNKAFPDNVNVEVNINPGKSSDELVENLRKCLYSLIKAVHPYTVTLQASGEYPKSECEHDDAKVFGCEPEFDCYKLEIVQAPSCETTFRSAGGHIHLGYAENKYPLMAPDEEDGGLQRAYGRVWVVRMMDLFMGIPSLWMDQDLTSPARRKLYGRAGTHRPKDYGVEYRPTGNFWLRSPATVRLIYDISKFVVDFVANKGHEKLWNGQPGSEDEKCIAYDVEEIQSAINNSDKKLASKFLNGLVKQYMPPKLFTEILVASEPVSTPFQTNWKF